MSIATSFTDCVQDLLAMSEEILNHLKTEAADHRQNRDQFIEEIQRLLDERQVIIDQLQRHDSELKTLIETNVSNEDRRRLMVMEKDITSGLRLIFNDIQKSRQLLRDKQRSRQQYRNPYASIKRDGMFVDKKK